MTSMFGAAMDFEHDDVDATVIFVDMAGFTSFTEAQGDHRAAQLAETFATLATRALGVHRRVIPQGLPSRNSPGSGAAAVSLANRWSRCQVVLPPGRFRGR